MDINSALPVLALELAMLSRREESEVSSLQKTLGSPGSRVDSCVSLPRAERARLAWRQVGTSSLLPSRREASLRRINQFSDNKTDISRPSTALPILS